MKNPGFQILLGVISGIGLLVLFFYAGLVPGFPRSDYVGPTLAHESVSPDGQYTARAERMSNGLGWCEERTTIDHVGTRSSWEFDSVFMIDCGSTTAFTWTADRELLITYGYDNNGKVHVSRDSSSKDNKVAITYRLVAEMGK